MKRLAAHPPQAATMNPSPHPRRHLPERNVTLFSIECATCQAKLNVRDAALIGQILACPKCSSMVMVEAPEGFEIPADSDESQASDSGESAEEEAEQRARWSQGSPGQALAEGALEFAGHAERIAASFASGAAARDPMATVDELTAVVEPGKVDTHTQRTRVALHEFSLSSSLSACSPRAFRRWATMRTAGPGPRGPRF